jgi:hypothetical protein
MLTGRCAYWANILYIVGMFGYLTIDTLTYVDRSIDLKLSSSIYCALAVVFVFDAILYTIDWYFYAVKYRDDTTAPIRYRSEAIACVFHLLGSQSYLLGAIFALDRPRQTGRMLLFNVIGIVALLVESAFTLLGWIVVVREHGRPRPCSADVSRVYRLLNGLGSL